MITILYDTTQYNTIQYDTIQHNTIQYYTAILCYGVTPNCGNMP